jgi:ATP-dependent Clp protease ATP-binding subunit ClpB
MKFTRWLVLAVARELPSDAANISLQNQLARGELRAIGATTLDEYQNISRKRQSARTSFSKKLWWTDSTKKCHFDTSRGIKEKYETS